MKIINKEGKLFGKISIIDIFVVIIVVAAIAFAGTKLTGGRKAENLKTAQYTFQIDKVRMQTVEAWQKNGVGIVDAESKDAMGNIVKISYSPAKELVKKSNGEYVIANHSDRYDMTLTVEVEVKETDKGYYTADNIYIAPGKELGLSNGFAQTFGAITGVTVE